MRYLIFLSFALVFVSCSVVQPARKKTVMVEIVTDSGTMVAKLYHQTPLHTENFKKLVRKNFYDGLLFHRVIPDFMIQGGDPNSRNAEAGKRLGDGGLPYTIPAEFDTALFHKRGALAMAREGDAVNPEKASSSTQFYIVEGKILTDEELDQMEERFQITIPAEHREVYKTVGGTPFLDTKYTVFGEVVEGLEVIEKISGVPRDRFDRPLGDIHMKIRLRR